jgi:hypothetical protein
LLANARGPFEHPPLAAGAEDVARVRGDAVVVVTAADHE